MSDVGFPLLSALVLAPFMGAFVVAVAPARFARALGVVTAAVGLGLGLWMLAEFDVAESGFQMVSSHTLLSSWGVSWSLGVDGISLFLVVLTVVLFLIALWGVDPHHDAKPYVVWMLLLQAGVLGTFLSLDLLLFFVFFELVLVPMYFIIGQWGYEDRVHSSLKFFLFTMVGSAFMLVAVLTTAFLYQDRTGVLTFDLVQIADAQVITGGAARWLFAAFAVAFAVKVPIFPLHTWLPDAHTQAPTAGSVILAGLLLKLGTYGLLRFGLYLFPDAADWFAPLFLTLGVIGIVYGAIVATMQRDLKRLIAYSSVAHLGFIVLGTFGLTVQGLSGGVMQMVNHGITTGALFLLVGMIYERRHTRQIAELRGIQQVAPIFAAAFTVVMLASIGVPGLNGFVGEFLILIGTFLTARWWTVVATAGVILAAVYLLWAYQRVFHGEADEPNRTFREMTTREGLVLAPLVALIVFLGVYPRPMLDRIEPSVDRLIVHVEDHTDYRQPAVAEGQP